MIVVISRGRSRSLMVCCWVVVLVGSLVLRVPLASAARPRTLSLLVVTVVWGSEQPARRFSEEHAINQAVRWYQQVSDGELTFSVSYSPVVKVQEESLRDNCLARARRAGIAARVALRARGVDRRRSIG